MVGRTQEQERAPPPSGNTMTAWKRDPALVTPSELSLLSRTSWDLIPFPKLSPSKSIHTGFCLHCTVAKLCGFLHSFLSLFHLHSSWIKSDAPLGIKFFPWGPQRNKTKTVTREAFKSERRSLRPCSSRLYLTALSHEHSGSQVPGIITIFNFRVVKDCMEHLPFLTLI